MGIINEVSDLRARAGWRAADDIDDVDAIDIRNLLVTACGRHLQESGEAYQPELYDRRTPLSSIYHD